MHRLDDRILITPALIRRFEDEGNFEAEGGYVGLLQLSDGKLVRHRRGPDPDAEQFMFAHDVLAGLNRNVAHDGAWVVVLVGPRKPDLILPLAKPTATYENAKFMWMDRDGDVKMVYEVEISDIADTMLKGIEFWVEGAEGAWKFANEMHSWVEPSEKQQHRAALGERAPSTVH